MRSGRAGSAGRIVAGTIGAALWWACAAAPARAADRPQWGEALTRNQVSEETGLPDTFDPGSGRNVLWTAPLGTETYSSPVIARGRVFIGTNNQAPRDPRLEGDRGVLLCLDERDGRLEWQLATGKRGPSMFWDWPRSGNCSPVTVEGDRVYTVTNRGEVVALDIDGMRDGNDGPYRDEARLLAGRDGSPIEPGATDADAIWLYDYTREVAVRQHDGAHCAILVWGDCLYINTSNGLNDEHDAIGNPDAPSLIVLDKGSGRLVAMEREGISRGIFHCTWSSPALGMAGDRPLIVFGGGDGVLYAFEPFSGKPGGAGPVPGLRLVWKHDCDPDAPKDRPPQRYIRNREVSPSNIKSMPVVHGGCVYVTYGGDVWWGKHQAWLKCVGLADGRERWRYPLERHCMATPAVRGGLAYAVDSGGKIHCIDAATGVGRWTHDAGGEMWASPLVADGRLHVGTRRGVFWILRAEGEPRGALARVDLRSPIHATAAAANGVLYVATMKTLHALKVGGK